MNQNVDGNKKIIVSSVVSIDTNLQNVIMTKMYLIQITQTTMAIVIKKTPKRMISLNMLRYMIKI